MEEVTNLLKIPPDYLCRNDKSILALTSTQWVKELVVQEQVPKKFLPLPDCNGMEVQSMLAARKLPQGVVQPWTFLQIQIVQVEDDLVMAMGEMSAQDHLSFPEALQLVNQCNTANLTHQARKKYVPGIRSLKALRTKPRRYEFLRLLKILYPEHLMLNFSSGTTEFPLDEKEKSFQQLGLVPLHCSVITDTCMILLFDYHVHTLGSVTRFSPMFMGDNQRKLLFIAYQLVNIFRTFQYLNLNIGEVQLKDFILTETLNVRFKPKLEECLVNVEKGWTGAETKENPLENNPETQCESICDIVESWTDGRLSNLDYILFLNKISGRRFGDPNFHPIVPWVTNFKSDTEHLRDLTKSKFRLNKGDELLDRTYETGQHHVTAVLSEITFYTYLARITDKKVLCKNVRPNWVPEEYPRSIQRLQEWSPDEAIPEFYLEPSVFKSIHSDLADLELPEWTKSPEEFIRWHRGILESEEVSKHLHSWIDLTFGYKLSGQAAIRNKNVCLDFCENQRDLADRGVVQLFTQPHPIKHLARHHQPKLTEFQHGIDLGELDEEINDEKSEKKTTISLPQDYNPSADIVTIETLRTFLLRADVQVFEDKPVNDDRIQRETNYLLKVKPMQVLGCLLSELFYPKKFRALGDEPSLEIRYRNAIDLLIRDGRNVCFSIRSLLRRLLLAENGQEFSLGPKDRYPVVSEQGLPLPSAELLLDPLLGSHFPSIFGPILSTLATLETLNHSAELVEDAGALESLTEFQVKLVARNISPLLTDLEEEAVELLVPLYSYLFRNPRTAVQASWYLLDGISIALGPDKTRKLFLDSIISHYKNHHTTKHIKLYHRSFMLILMTRLRMTVFLERFSYILIEATGGNREYPETPASTPCDASQALPVLDTEPGLAEGEIFSFDSWDSLGIDGKSHIDSGTISSVAQSLKHSVMDSVDLTNPVPFTIKEDDCHQGTRKENSVVQISKETLLWLSHRLGPVLTAKYITRNLLRMMGLCYLPPEGLDSTDMLFDDQQVRLSSSMLTGDCLSMPVIDCLRNIAELYGDHFILVQYLPFCWDLASLCRRKVTQNLEGSLLGSLAIVHSVIPLLSDSVLMKELDNITSHILCPIVHASTSSHTAFSSGASVRSSLIYKSLDVLYLLGLRIGEEMSRTHLTDLVAGLFTAFSKVFEDLSQIAGTGDSARTQKIQLSTELAEVLTRKMAYSVYVSFSLLLGENHMEDAVPNISLIKKLCLEYQAGLTTPAVRPYTYREIQKTLPIYNTDYSGSGNMIIVDSVDEASNTSKISKLIQASPGNTNRHLRGNWLAYWEHELGRSNKDGFNLKQIRLQSWTGHQGSVKSIAVLDNENSFISGGKDRTVRLWSLRNMGEGEFSGTAQWIYNGHRKPVFSVGYLAQKGLAVSCDGSIHIWDPFVGGLISEYEGPRGNAFCVMTPQTFSHSIIAASTEGNLALIDCRTKSVIDLKVSFGLVGLIRSVCGSGDGHQAAVGHSSGYISLLDLRTGRIRSGMKGHDGEVLTLTSGESYFVSTSLDQTASVYQWEDSKLWTHLRTPAEPLHCVVTYEEQIITGSTNHKISVHSIHREKESNTVVSKLRSDIIKGNLIQMGILPLNRLLLFGTDIGSIHLIC